MGQLNPSVDFSLAASTNYFNLGSVSLKHLQFSSSEKPLSMEVACWSIWTKDEDKAFENALAKYPEERMDRWEKIVEKVPGKSLEEIKHHYNLLIDDVTRIESGDVPLPRYGYSCVDAEEGTNKKGSHQFGDSFNGFKGSRSEQERRKGVAWTEDEHRLFLLGLDKYGKGDWRSISRNFVITRTPTQVASHAQKYFIRLNSLNKDRRRSSIHDITTVRSADVSSPSNPLSPPHLSNVAVFSPLHSYRSDVALQPSSHR